MSNFRIYSTTMEIKELISRAGNKELAIEHFLDGVRDGKIPFPYQRFYLLPAEEMFENLKQSQPFIVRKYFKPRAYYPFLYPISSLFYGKPVSITSNDEEYRKFDALSDHFIENVRITARRCDSISTLDLWQNRTLLREVLEPIFDRENYYFSRFTISPL